MKTRVFLVDDHALLRRGLESLINSTSDLEVCGQAEDCASATSEITKLNPDVVVTDLILGGNNGIELIKNVRVMNPEIKIIVLSAHDEPNYALRAIKAGARAYISKREMDGTIIETIRGLSPGTQKVADRVNGELKDCIVNGHDFADESPVARLSDRELEIVTLIGSGLDTREIAERLNVSEKTVAAHRLNIKAKLRLRNAIQLVHFCTRWAHENHFGPV